MAKSGRRSVNLVWSVFVVCLAIIAVIPGIAAQKREKGRKQSHPKVNIDDEIWTIAIGHLDAREEYLDPMSGEIKGFDVDIVNAVCEIAGRNCRWVENPYSNCWDTSTGVGLGGVGLFNFYYDACTAWNPTYPRARTFQFTGSFVKSGGSRFIVEAGNPGNFDWTNLTGKKIGLVTGFIADSDCLLRNSDIIDGTDLPEDSFVRYEGPNALRAGILSGEVDAGFDTRGAYPDTVEIVGDPIPCAMDGNAMMTRKDNKFKDWFDPALEELIGSERYVQICDDLINVHGALPGPGPEVCIGR